MHILMITFRLAGLPADEYSRVCSELAPTFAVLPGLLAKVWLTEDGDRRGGVYLFEDADAAERFTGSTLARMLAQNPHFADLSVQGFAVDEATTALTQPRVALVGASGAALPALPGSRS